MGQTYQIHQSVPANSTTPNALVGLPLEFFGQAATVTLYGNSDTVGVTISLLINNGQNISALIAPGSQLSAAATTGKVKSNEDFVSQFAVPAGSRLVLSLTNTTGAAIIVNALFVIG
jgi:hypothetical protein